MNLLSFNPPSPFLRLFAAMAANRSKKSRMIKRCALDWVLRGRKVSNACLSMFDSESYEYVLSFCCTGMHSRFSPLLKSSYVFHVITPPRRRLQHHRRILQRTYSPLVSLYMAESETLTHHRLEQLHLLFPRSKLRCLIFEIAANEGTSIGEILCRIRSERKEEEWCVQCYIMSAEKLCYFDGRTY